MNIGGGEAADQLVRMMLSGTEVAVRLGGSALKNMLALSLALAREHKQISGKMNMSRMLRETRDLRTFPMTPEQYRQFVKLAKKQKILYSAIHDKDDRGKFIDVVMPATELDRANTVLERVLRVPRQEQTDAPEHLRERGRRERTDQERGSREEPDGRQRPPEGPVKEQVEKEVVDPPKKGSRSQRDSPGTRASSDTSRAGAARTMSERPSVEGRLKAYQEQLRQRGKSAPVRNRSKSKTMRKGAR